MVGALALSCAMGCVIVQSRNDTGPIRDRTDPRQGMVVGSLKFPGQEIQGVLLYKDGTSYFAMEPRAPRAHVYANGDFVFENLEPTAYRLLCFYSRGVTYALMTHENKDDPRFRFEVRPGEITHVGAFVTSDNGIVVARVNGPTFREILNGLLPLANGTYWERKMLEALGRKDAPPRAERR
jgi:hypothetical protein